jgi:LmbE family N-acetylglucosaminyl deacetylase
MTFTSENWTGTKRILVVLAHPDDPEFFCGATIARWTSTGHIVSYCLLTHGDKGEKDFNVTTDEVARKREKEQLAAAAILNVKSVRFLNQPDGYLVPDMALRREVVRVIRQEKPDILMTCDPTNYFSNDSGINHPDHRAAGQVVIDAAFPAAGSAFFFPDLLVIEGLEPHSVKEVWMSVTSQPNTILDVTEFWEKKLRALKEHKSQIGKPEEFEKRMRTRRSPESSEEAPRFEERFRRIVYG